MYLSCFVCIYCASFQDLRSLSVVIVVACALDQSLDPGMQNQAFVVLGLLSSAWDLLQKMRLELLEYTGIKGLGLGPI